MAVRITVMVLRICGLLALIIGILYWVKVLNSSIVNIHMLLGILVVLSLWVLGYFILTAPKGANLGLAIGAFALGIIVLGVGMSQMMVSLGSAQWVLQVVHLILGVSALGIGEVIAGRYKRLNATNA
jgi:hypothetical protein